MSIQERLNQICIKHHGELPELSIREQLDNLSDELIEDILQTSDADILKEVEEDHGNKNFLANKCRKIFEKVGKQYGF